MFERDKVKKIRSNLLSKEDDLVYKVKLSLNGIKQLCFMKEDLTPSQNRKILESTFVQIKKGVLVFYPG